MEIKTYQYQAKLLLDDYLLADTFIPYTSVTGGVLSCKMMITPWYYKGYARLTKVQRVEWGNRWISTAHAIFISIMALYLVYFSDLFSDSETDGLILLRSSSLSVSALGISVGYFMSDLGMIIWSYPSLGGMEYVVHHLLSILSVAYSMSSGECQMYTLIVLISEITTPCVNLRWYLDTAGMKRSRLYLLNGIMMFFTWMMMRCKYYQNNLVFHEMTTHIENL